MPLLIYTTTLAFFLLKCSRPGSHTIEYPGIDTSSLSSSCLKFASHMPRISSECSCSSISISPSFDFKVSKGALLLFQHPTVSPVTFGLIFSFLKFAPSSCPASPPLPRAAPSCARGLPHRLGVWPTHHLLWCGLSCLAHCTEDWQTGLPPHLDGLRDCTWSTE